ncbi:MAG: tRNA (guanosine(37)-N1)-methyltransferase TrmD [Candidatus Omnitrophota bacterium]
MRIDILTIFPGMFREVLGESMIKRAQEKKKVSIRAHDLRDYTLDKHRKVDDRPFGGGSGMVMSAEPIFRAVEALRKGRRRAQGRVILLGPQGRKLDQKAALELSALKWMILICGHYEGVDERVRAHLADEEISVGDYILTGGEIPAMALADCVVRLIPGVLGDKNSLNFESFEGNLLEYAQYTRPADFRGMKVPEILLRGDHGKISDWRREDSLRRTRQKRPDLLKKHYTV